MSSTDKSIRLQKRGTDQFHNVTPATWAKMKEQGKGEYYLEVTAPSIPKEVAAKVANDKKLSGKLNPESDQQHGLQTNSDRLPVENAG